MGERDTSIEAERVQMAIWRRLGPSGRVAIAVRMSDELREVARSGIRCRHAAYSEQDVELALRRLTLGDALFTAAFPGMPLLAP